MSTKDRFTSTDLELCLGSGEHGLGRLVEHLRPVLHARVARILLRRGRLAASDLHEQVQELIQEIFLILFRDEAHVLRAWNPELGMSLENYVGLITERRVASILRDRNRLKRAADERPKDGEALLFELRDQSPDPSIEAEDRQTLRRLLSRLEEQASPTGWRIFQMRFVEELEIEEISSRTGMSPGAIYASIKRLRRLARDLRDEPARGESHAPVRSEKMP